MSIIVLSACDTATTKGTSNTDTPEIIDYTDKDVLDSLIQILPQSNDTIFLGFKMGMTKSEYKSHVEKLKVEGKTITYSKSNRISTAYGSFDIGEGYTFETPISSKIDDRTLTGEGKYILDPVYSKSNNLIKLVVLPFEDWDNWTGVYKPKWLENRVINSSEKMDDENLIQVLINNGVIDDTDFIRRKNNTVIYSGLLTISYVDYKYLLTELLVKETEKDIIKEKNEEIAF